MLTIPNNIYDYLLFYECATKDWKNPSIKMQVAQNNPGGLVDEINWGVSSSTTKGDSGGATKCGITHGTWKEWYNKNSGKYGLSCGSDINKLDKTGWMSYIQDTWSKGPGKAANVACGIVIFQAKWGGWSGAGTCLTELRNKAKAEGSTYTFSNNGDVYSKIADATHAFKNPMDAFQIIRNSHQKFLYDLSAPGKPNHKFRVGWMRREVAPFQDDGLYIESGVGELLSDSNKHWTIEEWKAACNQLKGKGKYIKLCDWDNMPTTIEIFATVALGSKSQYKNTSSYLYTDEDGNVYQPKFSSSKRDPRLSASKKATKQPGVLLGPNFNIK